MRVNASGAERLAGGQTSTGETVARISRTSAQRCGPAARRCASEGSYLDCCARAEVPRKQSMLAGRAESGGCRHTEPLIGLLDSAVGSAGENSETREGWVTPARASSPAKSGRTPLTDALHITALFNICQ